MSKAHKGGRDWQQLVQAVKEARKTAKEPPGDRTPAGLRLPAMLARGLPPVGPGAECPD